MHHSSFPRASSFTTDCIKNLYATQGNLEKLSAEGGYPRHVSRDSS